MIAPGFAVVRFSVPKGAPRVAPWRICIESIFDESHVKLHRSYRVRQEDRHSNGIENLVKIKYPVQTTDHVALLIAGRKETI